MRSVATLVSTLLICAALARGEGASSLSRQGRKAEKAGDFARAYLLYSQAAALDWGNRAYWGRSQALRTRAITQAKVEPKAEPSAPSPPALTAAELEAVSGKLTDAELAEARKMQPPASLKPNPGRKGFSLQVEPRRLFDEVTRAFGLDTVFDGDYPQGGQPVRFHLTQANWREALRALEVSTASFTIPLGDHLMLVVKDTTEKRNQAEPLAAVTIPIPEPVSVQEAQELARAVQQVLEIRRFFVDSQRRLVFLRDKVSKIMPAQIIFSQLLNYRTEVEIEVEFIEVSRKSSLSYGLQLPTQFPMVNFGKLWRNAIPSVPQGFLRFAVFGGGAGLMGIGLGNAQVIANMSRSDGRSLLRTQMRSLDGQPASFHVGDKYPIMTGSFYGGGLGAGGALGAAPSFNFEDLGLVLKITPHVHGIEDVTLEVEAEFKVLTGESMNGIPVIANRQLKSQVRLQVGEWAVIAGLMNVNQARTISGLVGLATLPGLGPLFRQNSRNKDSNEALLLLKPRLLSLPASERPALAFWTGTETRFSFQE